MTYSPTRSFLTDPRDSGCNQTGNPHAALAGVGKREGGPSRQDIRPSRPTPMSLPERPVDESPTCVHDNNMHTNRTDGRQRGGIA